ncbi:MAG: cell division protein ZapE [Pseudomonadota bacterium]
MGTHPPAPRGSDVEAWLREHARRHGFELDAAQQQTLPYFQKLHDELLIGEHGGVLGWLAQKRQHKGIYLWGGVGRGKSFLMDSFYACMPITHKRRLHFHRFMQRVHRELTELQGRSDPVQAVAASLAAEAKLLCLDELHVTDIGDAMIMRRLLEGLFEHGVVLVITSNQHPDDLYRHGLQRSQFEPAIELLKTHLELIDVDGGRDYRLQTLEQAGVYQVGRSAEARLHDTFLRIARHVGEGETRLEIDGRMIRVRQHGAGAAWFEFIDLCGGPRAQSDYIELAKRFHTVFVSNLPRFSEADSEAMRRFIWLVDEFYDRRVKLMLGAEAVLAEIFPPSQQEEYSRTASRLVEMQSVRYLGEPHLP